MSAVLSEAFTPATDREDCWIHPTAPVWIVFYEATQLRREFYQVYRAVVRLPKGRRPWTVDNRALSSNGFRAFDEAVSAAMAAS